MTVSRDIRLSIIAEVQKYAAEMAKIPGVTEKQAAAAARKLAGELAKAEREAAADARKAATQSAKAWKDSFKGLDIASGIISAAALQAGVRRIADLTAEVVELRTQISDMSASSGLATDTLAGLRLAAEGSGMQLDHLRAGLVTFPKRMSDAARGTGEAKRAFDRLGISVTDANGVLRESDDVFREFMDRLSEVESPTERAALVTEAFGESGGKLLEALGDPRALDEFVAFATEYGADIGPEASQASADWKRAVAELGTVLDGTKAELVDFIDAGQGVENVTLGFVFMKETVAEVADIVVRSFEIMGTAMFSSWEDILSGELQKQILDYQSRVGTMSDRIMEATEAFWEQREATRAASEGVEEYAGIIGGPGEPGTVTGNLESAIEEIEKLTGIADAATTSQLQGAQKIIAARDQEIERIRELMAVGREQAASADELLQIRIEGSEAILAVTRRAESQILDLRLKAEERSRKEAEKTHRQSRRLAEQRFRDAMAEIEAIREEKAAMQEALMAGTTDAFGQISNLLAQVGGAFKTTKAASKAFFRAQQAGSIIQATISMFQAINKAIALFGPPPSPVGIAAMAAAATIGGAQIAAIAAQKPPEFHGGGVVGFDTGFPLGGGVGPGDQLVVAQVGEEILTPEQRGKMAGGTEITIVQKLDHRAYGAQTVQALRLGGPLADAVRPFGFAQARFNR